MTTSDLLARAHRLEGYAAQDPANLALLRDLADTWHQAGEHERALAAVERAQPLDAAASWEPLRGKLLLALGRWDEARAVYERALQAEPGSAALLFNLGYAVRASGTDPLRAAELMQQAAELQPDNADVQCHLALALEEAGEPARAEQALEQVLAKMPSHDKALAQLAQLKLDAGDFDAASALAGRCIAAAPSQAAGWHLKGQIALFQMDGAAAAKSLRQALDLDPNDVDTRIALAQASLMQGRTRHAHALLAEAVEHDPGHDQALCMLGWSCVALDDSEGAAAAFERAHALAPDNPDALAGQALIHLSRMRREQALELAQRALALDAGHVTAKLIVARAQELAGQGVESRASMQSVVASTPFGPLHATLGEALEAGAASPAARRLQRRFSKAARPSQPQHRP